MKLKNFLLDEIIRLLHQNIEEFKIQRIFDNKEGRKSASRRKHKNIKLYEDALKKVKKGIYINIESLPQPTPTKLKYFETKVQNSRSTINDDTVSYFIIFPGLNMNHTFLSPFYTIYGEVEEDE